MSLAILNRKLSLASCFIWKVKIANSLRKGNELHLNMPLQSMTYLKIRSIDLVVVLGVRRSPGPC